MSEDEGETRKAELLDSGPNYLIEPKEVTDQRLKVLNKVWQIVFVFGLVTLVLAGGIIFTNIRLSSWQADLERERNERVAYQTNVLNGRAQSWANQCELFVLVGAKDLPVVCFDADVVRLYRPPAEMKARPS